MICHMADDYAKALAGKSWMRFQEAWMGHGPEQDTAQIENAVLESAVGIPFVARTDPAKHSSLIYPACAFLIAQGPYCYFGASTGWTDQNWAWHGEYDWRLGRPLSVAVRASQWGWARRFEHGNVSVDVKASRCRLSFSNGTVLAG